MTWSQVHNQHEQDHELSYPNYGNLLCGYGKMHIIPALGGRMGHQGEHHCWHSDITKYSSGDC